MPPRIPRVGVGFSWPSRLPFRTAGQQICPICTFSQQQRVSILEKPRKQQRLSPSRIDRRRQSNFSNASETQVPRVNSTLSARAELHEALSDLQKHAANYVNISRLQLALRGLEQSVGEETIRIAFLGLADGGKSLKKAKQLVRLLLADPLKAEEEWERILLDDQPGNRPILLRVGNDVPEESGYSSRMIQELHVSSPVLNGHKLEILVLETGLPESSDEFGNLAETVLVPTMEIPTSNTGRYTPVTTPVHKSLVVSHGILGAGALLPVARRESSLGEEIISTVVDIKLDPKEDRLDLPFQLLNIDLASSALDSFRQSVNNALDYEHQWFASGAPEILEWIKAGTSPVQGSMKLPVRKLVESVLESTDAAMQAERARQMNVALKSKISRSDFDMLERHTSKWAENAHTELRDHLDIAFNGHRWRKLGWWKLFWRVDDVSMIATDILSRRFLTDAEKEVIFLSGRIEEAGVFKDAPDSNVGHWAYKAAAEERLDAPKLGDVPLPPKLKDLIRSEDGRRRMKNQNWPLNIPATRDYLSLQTVPALQALAQKLVFQTLTTTTLFSGLAALTYVSTISTGLYEAGAIAALGTVYSMRRMQGKWETARKFWEGEVREEGRKTVRKVEGIVGDVLKASDITIDSRDSELEKAVEAAKRVEESLGACK